MMTHPIRPPLGITPTKIWLENRQREIYEYFGRLSDHSAETGYGVNKTLWKKLWMEIDMIDQILAVLNSGDEIRISSK